jgi:hypothetical protein
MIIGPHAQRELVRRQIPEAWVWETLQQPDAQEHWLTDGREHYFHYIAVARGKCLHVIVEGPRVVTLSFDRRRGRRP